MCRNHGIPEFSVNRYFEFKPLTTYTSNWYFDHGTGKGTGECKHDQKDSSKAYTSSNPAQGITFDAKHVSGHATIRYYEK